MRLYAKNRCCDEYRSGAQNVNKRVATTSYCSLFVFVRTAFVGAAYLVALTPCILLYLPCCQFVTREM
eukprot:m.99214 g.99214  ORF g.99214 m.99214 type:complete len:68 (+) comp37050_c0_seq8:926-1129(+)